MNPAATGSASHLRALCAGAGAGLPHWAGSRNPIRRLGESCAGSLPRTINREPRIAGEAHGSLGLAAALSAGKACGKSQWMPAFRLARGLLEGPSRGTMLVIGKRRQSNLFRRTPAAAKAGVSPGTGKYPHVLPNLTPVVRFGVSLGLFFVRAT